jgi:hypothetical protein
MARSPGTLTRASRRACCSRCRTLATGWSDATSAMAMTVWNGHMGSSRVSAHDRTAPAVCAPGYMKGSTASRMRSSATGTLAHSSLDALSRIAACSNTHAHAWVGCAYTGSGRYTVWALGRMLTMLSCSSTVL